ncbi:hypothetical protein AWV80_27335 [Cupriavidus sp. UYMU48A]|nr:hypothetical protein AWV80_27335 [Cupriavidus sp. UYMU48A]
MRFAQAAGIGLLALCAACGTSGGASKADMASAAAASGPKLLDPLPAWRDGAAKQSILNFVSKTTTPGSPEFVAPEDRIAVFDNDGTLWREDPVVELLFVVNRAQERARAEPALAGRSPYKEFLADPAAYFKSTGEAGAVRLLNELYGNTSLDTFQEDARRYVANARHPKSKARCAKARTSRCWNCWRCCARTATRPGSARAARRTSCASSPSLITAFPRNRSSAPGSPRSSAKAAVPTISGVSRRSKASTTSR